MTPEEKAPNVGRSLLKRGALCGLVIVLLAAGSVSAAGFLQADTIINTIEKEGRAPINIPEIDRAEAGEAQTLMVLGSDQRYGDKKAGLKPRSDTIILVRLDPDKEATAVMSVPRDLKVQIPGYGTDKINAAYELGGPRLTVKTVKKLFAKPGEPFKINHIVNVNFGGFRKVVNYIGGVYVDIDRDYFNDNSGGERFATIDVNPGYQKLKGQDALDYVRYRHGDNDLVRAARQQDFLRQLRNAAGARRLLDYRRRRQLARLFARYTDTDKNLRRKKDVFSLLKLVLFTGRKPVREVRFRVDLDRRPGLPDRLAGQARRDRQRVPQRPGVEEAAHHVARLRRRPQVGVRAQEPQPLLQRAAGSRSRAARARTRRSSAPAARGSPSTSRRCAPAARATPAPSRGSTRIEDERGKKHKRLPARGLQGRRRRVLRHPGHDLARAADPRRPVGDPQGQRPQARAALRRAPPAARRLADQARGLLGLQHAHPVAEHAADDRHRRLAEAVGPEVSRSASRAR